MAIAQEAHRPIQDIQTTNEILMIRPTTIAANPQTQASNCYQKTETPTTAQTQVPHEFDQAVESLRQAGIEVNVIQDTEHPKTPDAHFPNNWFTTHADGLCVIYPLLASNRKAEVKSDPLELLEGRYDSILDLRTFAGVLEGTGSLVLDRCAKRAFACRSPRTTPKLLKKWAKLMNYEVIYFDAEDEENRPIYHTNVMMSVGTNWAVVALESISSRFEQTRILHALSGRSVIEITQEQVKSYCGNILELQNRHGDPVIVMSSSAKEAFSTRQIRSLESHGEILALHIPTIEAIGGGSVRCMIAELF